MTAPPTGYYNDVQLATIDERIAAFSLTREAVGRVTAVIDEVHATVTLDESAAAVDVLVAGHVQPNVGDRLLLHYYGPRGKGQWVALGTLAVRTLASANISAVLGTGSVSAAGWTDIVGTPGFTWSKHHAASVVRMQIAINARVTGATLGSLGQFGMKFIPDAGGTPQWYMLAQHFYNVNSIYHSCSGFDRFDDLAAGTYSVVGQWQRVSGDGPIGVDSNCLISMEVTEEWVEVLV